MKPSTDLAHSGQPLPNHLIGVAKQTQEFASYFDGAKDGWIAGLLHDLGKAEDEIQKRIATDDKEGKKEPHAHHGAALLLDDREKTGFVQKPFWPAAFAINGHHAGLHDRSSLQKIKASHVSKANTAWKRLNSDTAWADLRNDFDIAKFSLPPSHLPDWLNALAFDATFASEGWRAVDFYTRFLFSALVDADRLDTEINDLGLDKSKEQRRWRNFDAEGLLGLVEEQLHREQDQAEENKVSAGVRKLRDEVGDACCRPDLHKERGIFTLTVPTGGGKTLASLLFALHHAKHHNKAIDRGSTIWRHSFRRVIIVIPYLSIAAKTGFNYEDLDNFFFALTQMFGVDTAAARPGGMRLVGLVDFQHKDALGNAPAHKLFDLVKVRGVKVCLGDDGKPLNPQPPRESEGRDAFNGKWVFNATGSEFPQGLQDYTGSAPDGVIYVQKNNYEQVTACTATKPPPKDDNEPVAAITAHRIIWQLSEK